MRKYLAQVRDLGIFMFYQIFLPGYFVFPILRVRLYCIKIESLSHNGNASCWPQIFPNTQILSVWLPFTQYRQKCCAEGLLVGVLNLYALQAELLHLLSFFNISFLFYSIPLCSSSTASNEVTQYLPELRVLVQLVILELP